jgi:hypothetical protein
VRVFVSSLISGYEPYRAAAAEAVETLGHQIVRAEDFPASPGTPQQACLAAVRDSDLIILLIGEGYGNPQPSGLSATHEEYREAKQHKPVLIFVESGVVREPAQQEFLIEVQAWATGNYLAGYSSPEQLKTVVLRALHDHELATAIGPVDEAEMMARATAALPDDRRSTGVPRLIFAVAGGPHQQVLRPVELEQTDLSRDIQREALFGGHAVLDSRQGTSPAVRGSTLVLEQPSGSLSVDQAGTICVVQPLDRDDDRHRTGVPSLIAEDLVAALVQAIRFSDSLLERIDPLHRLTQLVPVARIAGAGFMTWRTRAEHTANPNLGSLHGSGDVATATLTPARRHRQALTHDASNIAEDLVTLLRRQIRG